MIYVAIRNKLTFPKQQAILSSCTSLSGSRPAAVAVEEEQEEQESTYDDMVH